MGLTEADIDEGFIAEARAVLATGTHLSHPRTEAAVLKALNLARKHGARTALDIDYRPNLWGVAGHGEGESRFVESAEVTKQAAGDAASLRFSTGYEELSRFAADQGVTMGYHHHMGTIVESAARDRPLHGDDRPGDTSSCSTPATASSAAATRPSWRASTWTASPTSTPRTSAPRSPREVESRAPLLPRRRAPRRLHRARRPRGRRRLRAGAEDRRRARLLRLARHRGRAGPGRPRARSSTRAWASRR